MPSKSEPSVPREPEDLAYFGDLQQFDGRLPRDSTVELALFAGVELRDVQGGNTRFLECAFTDTALSGSMRRARLTEVWMRRVRLIDVDLAETTWHDVTVLDSSIAAVEAYGSRLHRVVLDGCKVNSLNLREATLTDVDFVDCVLHDLDLMGATLKNVRFIGTTIEGMDLTRSTLQAVDLSRALDVQLTSDGDSLRGAVISSGQLMTMAPELARALGVVVRD